MYTGISVKIYYFIEGQVQLISIIIMYMNNLMLTLKAPSLHGNISECGAKEVNIRVFTDFS